MTEFCRFLALAVIMGGTQPSKLLDSNIINGLSYLEDGQFAKIYKVTPSSHSQ